MDNLLSTLRLSVASSINHAYNNTAVAKEERQTEKHPSWEAEIRDPGSLCDYRVVKLFSGFAAVQSGSLDTQLHCRFNCFATSSYLDCSAVIPASHTCPTKKHLDKLSIVERQAFLQANATITPDSLLGKIRTLDKQHALTSSYRPHAERIARFLSLLDRLLGGVAIAIQANPDISSIAVGGIKLITDIAVGFTKYFGKLTDMFNRLSETIVPLERYAECIELLNVENALIDVYGDILDFCKASSALFLDQNGRSKVPTTLRVFLHSQWVPFEAEFGDIAGRMGHHCNESISSYQPSGVILTLHSQGEGGFFTLVITATGCCRRASLCNGRQSRPPSFYGAMASLVRETNTTTQRSNVINHIQNNHAGKQTGICFAYFSFTDPTFQDYTRLIALFLKQLCQQHDKIPEKLLRAKRDAREPSGVLNTGMFTSATQLYQRVFIVIDGLDECPEERRSPILDFMVEASSDSNSNLKIFVSSRKELDISAQFALLNTPVIDLKTGTIIPDIRSFVQHEASRLRTESKLHVRDDDLFGEIVQKLVEESNGIERLIIYLKVSLQCTRNHPDLPLDKLQGDFWRPLMDSHDAESILACRCMDWLSLALPTDMNSPSFLGAYINLDYPVRLLANITRLLGIETGRLASLVRSRLIHTQLGSQSLGRGFDETLAKNYLFWTSELYLLPGLDDDWVGLEIPKYALHFAVWFRPEKVPQLLSTSPLGFAIQKNHFELTKVLLQANINSNVLLGTRGQVPLMMAASLEMVKFLCETYNFDINATDNVGRSVLGYFVGAGPYLLDRHIDAAEATRVIDYLIERGADIYVKSMAGMSLIDYAVCREDDVESLQLLLKRGPNLVDKKADEWTPLHWACREGNIGMAKLLLGHGQEAKKVTTVHPPKDWTPYDILIHFGFQDESTLESSDKSTIYALGRPKVIMTDKKLSEEPFDYKPNVSAVCEKGQRLSFHCTSCNYTTCLMCNHTLHTKQPGHILEAYYNFKTDIEDSTLIVSAIWLDRRSGLFALDSTLFRVLQPAAIDPVLQFFGIIRVILAVLRPFCNLSFFSCLMLGSDEVASQLLFSLDGFKERLEVTSTKAVEVVTLDDFDEDSRAVQHMLHVIGFRHLDELHASGFEVSDGSNDVSGSESHMLNTSTTIEVNVFLNLRLLLSLCGLGFFVVGADVVHFVPVLVADAVVDGFEGDGWEDQVQGVLGGGLEAEAREEEAAVVLALDQGVSGLSVGLDGGGLDVAEFTFVDGMDSTSSTSNATSVFSYHITMSLKMLVNLLNQLPLILRDIVQHTQSTKRRSQDESDASVAHDVGGDPCGQCSRRLLVWHCQHTSAHGRSLDRKTSLLVWWEEEMSRGVKWWINRWCFGVAKCSLRKAPKVNAVMSSDKRFCGVRGPRSSSGRLSSACDDTTDVRNEWKLSRDV
ncbi:4-hydroxyphenylpyruvate dioxygenase, partial [Aureobasidium melanogenum]